jgi:hypothetical protein
VNIHADNLTVAYIAHGAFEFIRDQSTTDEGRMLIDRMTNRYEGQFVFINAVIEFADVLELAYIARDGELSAVWPYECCEPFGYEIAKRLAEGQEPKANEVADDLIREACK